MKRGVERGASGPTTTPQAEEGSIGVKQLDQRGIWGKRWISLDLYSRKEASQIGRLLKEREDSRGEGEKKESAKKS